MQKLLDIASKFSREIVDKIELFINKFDEDLDQAIKDIYEGKDIVLENILELKSSKSIEEFNKEQKN